MISTVAQLIVYLALYCAFYLIFIVFCIFDYIYSMFLWWEPLICSNAFGLNLLCPLYIYCILCSIKYWKTEEEKNWHCKWSILPLKAFLLRFGCKYYALWSCIKDIDRRYRWSIHSFQVIYLSGDLSGPEKLIFLLQILYYLETIKRHFRWSIPPLKAFFCRPDLASQTLPYSRF